jgi:hypothetical protein
MQISVWVRYDEKQLRRTLKFVMRPQMKLVRASGALLIAIGLGLAVLVPTSPVAYGAIVLGVVFAVAIAPITLSQAVRAQSHVIKHGYHLSLDDEWVTVSFPLAESRLRWAGLDRAVETPEAWYVMFGRMQALSIPKGPMTQDQRAQFAAFVAGWRPAGTGPGRR